MKYNHKEMQVYRTARVYTMLSAIPTIPLNHPVVVRIIENYKQKSILGKDRSTEDLVHYEESKNLLNLCTSVAADQLAMIETTKQEIDASGKEVIFVFLMIGCIAGIISVWGLLICVPCIIAYLQYFDKVMDREHNMNKQIRALRFFEQCLTEVENKDVLFEELMQITKE